MNVQLIVTYSHFGKADSRKRSQMKSMLLLYFVSSLYFKTFSAQVKVTGVDRAEIIMLIMTWCSLAVSILNHVCIVFIIRSLPVVLSVKGIYIPYIFANGSFVEKHFWREVEGEGRVGDELVKGYFHWVLGAATVGMWVRFPMKTFYSYILKKVSSNTSQKNLNS